MSLAANDHRAPSGKTPPPAPSAAFAKRARELQAEERRYRPPALRAALAPPSPDIDLDPANLPPSNYQPGFRRARAGTLPSNVQLAAQRFAAASTSLSTSTESFSQSPSPINTQPAATSASVSATSRPGLRHASTSVSTPAAPPLVVPERNSRLRSGSLTLPSAGLSNAFGPSLFSSSWLSSTNGSGNNSFPVLDELRSVTSADSGAEEYDVHTLDYLGLDDRQRPPPAATISELRNQAQAAIAGNLANPPRVRASTVSNPYRTRPSVATSLLATPATDEEEEEYFESYEDQGYGRILSYDTPADTTYGGSSTYIAKGFKQTDHLAPANGLGSRPRAISVGVLDDPVRSLQRRAAVLEAQQYVTDTTPTSSNPHTPPGILKSTSRGPGAPANVHFPNGELAGNRSSPSSSSYLITPTLQQQNHRAISPKSDGPINVASSSNSSQIQTPTRSLWIGNLDSAVTSEQLIHVFAPYGAIESLRLLPEKECGFVNFVDQADAIRAKEDVLNRLGGNIGMPNGQPVRIGFGKADSAPVAPAKGSTVTTSGASTPSGMSGKSQGSGGGSGSPGVGAGMGTGMDAQLQSSPTRALWLGSIPSTTTPAAILSVFSPYGPIESARVLTHKNCGFINFERLDDAVRARKALNGRDVLGSDVGAIRIGFAKVPVKGGQDVSSAAPDDPGATASVQGVGNLSVGATIHALRSVKGASAVPADQQVLGGAVENYRSNLLLSMIGAGALGSDGAGGVGGKPAGWTPSVTEQQMIMRELCQGSNDGEADIQALSEFRPPTMYYTSIPLVAERSHIRRWDASKLRELRKRLDSGTMGTEEIDLTVSDFLSGEIVDLASDWLGNTVVQKLFERCSPEPRFAMLERISPHLAMIGIHKNGTWAAQKIIECVQSPEEVALVAQNLRAYAPPLLLDQFGNYVVQCCLRFGAPANDFIFDAIVDRMWEIAQGRFGARSMRACLESQHITISQQRRTATAVILNSIPLATNPNGALLLTWLLDSSGFPSRYNLLAPRFVPHLSHLCTHKLASLTVLRIVNQKVEPEASAQIVEALFSSPGDHVLTDVLGDQVNGVAVVQKVLGSPYVDAGRKKGYVESTKRVLVELKVVATQAYRRLIEEVGLPVPSFQGGYTGGAPGTGMGTNTGGSVNVGSSQGGKKGTGASAGYLMGGYQQQQHLPANDQGLASMMAALQMGGQNPQAGHVGVGMPMQGLQIDTMYGVQGRVGRAGNGAGSLGSGNGGGNGNGGFSSATEVFNPFALRSPDMPSISPRVSVRRGASGNGVGGSGGPVTPAGMGPNVSPYGTPAMGSGSMLGGLGAASYNGMTPPPPAPSLQTLQALQHMQGMQGLQPLQTHTVMTHGMMTTPPPTATLGQHQQQQQPLPGQMYPAYMYQAASYQGGPFHA